MCIHINIKIRFNFYAWNSIYNLLNFFSHTFGNIPLRVHNRLGSRFLSPSFLLYLFRSPLFVSTKLSISSFQFWRKQKSRKMRYTKESNKLSAGVIFIHIFFCLYFWLSLCHNFPLSVASLCTHITGKVRWRPKHKWLFFRDDAAWVSNANQIF